MRDHDVLGVSVSYKIGDYTGWIRGDTSSSSEPAIGSITFNSTVNFQDSGVICAIFPLQSVSTTARNSAFYIL